MPDMMPPIVDKFLGEDIAFWVELKHKLFDTNAENWVRRCAVLSAKVQFYEKMLDDVARFREGCKNA